jgi:hypothetical protein
MPADSKQERLNAAAEAVGTALGRFAAELAQWTHRGARGGRQPDVAKALTAALAANSARIAKAPSNGRIGALAEIAHVPQPHVKTRKAGARRTTPAKPRVTARKSPRSRATR